AWVARALLAALPGGFEVVPCTTARGALNACCALEPDAMVTGSMLADESALWLALTLRAQSIAAAATPIIMLSPAEEEERIIAALQSGIDVVVPRPFALVELWAQIQALVNMAARMRKGEARGSSSSFLPGGADGPRRAIIGDLVRMPVATVLGAL